MLLKYNTEDVEVTFLKIIENFFKTNKNLIPILPHIIKHLYDGDILEEDTIIYWWNSLPKRSLLKKKLKVLITWLQTAEEED